MTTIAACVRSLTMAGDRKTTYGDTSWENTKIHRVGDRIVGLAGHSCHGQKFLDWLRGGSLPEYKTEADDCNFAALVLSASGLVYYDKELVALPVEQEFFAIGSGSQAALAAMHMGAGPKKAVEIACLIDPNTGIGVDVLRLVKRMPR